MKDKGDKYVYYAIILWSSFTPVFSLLSAIVEFHLLAFSCLAVGLGLSL